MSVQSTARYAGPFAGNGVATVFAFGFKVFAASDIIVTTTVTIGGAVSNPINGVDYTVALNADQNVNPGGNVTFAVAPPATVSFYITSGIPKAQGSQFPNPGPWNPTTGESAWDKSMMIIQELGQAALLFAPGDVASTHVLPSPAARAGKTLFFDAAGVLAVGAVIGALSTTVIGQIPFGAAANTLAQDANLFWDNTNKRLGIGNAAPTVALDVTGTVKTPQITSPAASDLALNVPTGQIGRLNINAVTQFAWDATALFAASNNSLDSGKSGNTWRSGYFGTSVVTPLVLGGGTSDLTLGAGVSNHWVIPFANGFLTPFNDNSQNIGSATKRVANIFTPIIDSGTTGSLSLKTNNGVAQVVVSHVAATNQAYIQGGISSAPLFGVNPASTDTNVDLILFTKGSGTINFQADGTGTTQFQVLRTASATRNITVTGSNGGNPTIGVTAGSLAITPNVVIAGNLNVGNSNATPGSTEIVFGSNGAAILRVRNSANSGDVIPVQVATQVAVDIVNVGAGSCNGVYVKARSGGAAPTTTDLPAGFSTVWRDTGGATTKLYYNNAGTIQSVALA